MTNDHIAHNHDVEFTIKYFSLTKVWVEKRDYLDMSQDIWHLDLAYMINDHDWWVPLEVWIKDLSEG